MQTLAAAAAPPLLNANGLLCTSYLSMRYAAISRYKIPITRHACSFGRNFRDSAKIRIMCVAFIAVKVPYNCSVILLKLYSERFLRHYVSYRIAFISCHNRSKKIVTVMWIYSRLIIGFEYNNRDLFCSTRY